MIRIILDNNKSRLIGKRKRIHELREEFKMRSPGYFWSPAYRRRVWDGYVRYITETGMFSTGLLEEVVNRITVKGWKYRIEDERESFKDVRTVKELGGLDFRYYQFDAVRETLEHKLCGVKFVRGILWEATNAGKNLIAAGIHKSFSSKRKTLFLIDSKTIFEQALKEISELLPGEVGQVSSKKVYWKPFTICMVQSLFNLMKRDRRARNMVEGFDIILVDEADTTALRKQGKTCLQYALNAPIRIALSGTPLQHKDPTRNMEMLAFFGPIIHRTTNKQLVDAGHSSKASIRIMRGNMDVKAPKHFREEYELGIIKNIKRNRKIWRMVRRGLNKDRGPFLLLIKEHEHIEQLLKTCPKDIRQDFSIEWCHHKTKNRKQILDRYLKGEIEILICSMIIRRGINLKNIRTLINCAGGDSWANVMQILGRLLRKDARYKRKYFYDFWDEGAYLKRHSRHRVKHYKDEGLGIKELYKR